MTNASPSAAALGVYGFTAFGTTFSTIASTIATTPAMIIAVSAPAGIASIPVENSSATAFHATTAGAGHSSVTSISPGLGISTRYAPEPAIAPAKAPQICASDCSRGEAPIRCPHFMSCSRSAHWLDAPPVTLAAIRLAVALPGVRPANNSCVTLPIAPTGVMLVSPATRAATMASTKVKPTPTTAAHSAISKNERCRATDSTRAASTAVMNHLRVTSPVSRCSPPSRDG